MSRQGSHKDKDISGAGGTRNGSGSCVANSESTHAIMRNETAKQASPDIQKCVPMRDTSLVISSVKNSLNKTASETESIDTAPLFCKSVSAQNLSIDNNFLQPVSTRVQKSFSFTETHRNPHYPLSPANSMVDTSYVFKTNPKDISHDKAEVKKEQPTGTNMSNQKHFTCTLFEHETLTQKLTSPPALLYVCPWEFTSSLPSSSPPVAKGENSLASDVESSRPVPPISSSAPGSPYNFAKPMARCGLSFHSATQTLLLARDLVAKKGSGKYASKNELSKEEGASQQSRSVPLSSAIKSVKTTPQTQMQSMTCVDSKPCLVKQAAIRVSPVRNSVSNVSPHIYLWESEAKEYENTIQCQNSGKQRLSVTPTMERPNPSWHQDRASLTVPRSTVCQWRAPNKIYRQSNIADICPWEVKQQELQPKGFYDDDSTWDVDSKHMQITTGDKGICPWESLGQASGINSKSSKGIAQHPRHTESEVSPCEFKDSAKSVSEAAKPSERVLYVNAHPDKKKQSLVRQETLQTDVCPWDTTDTHTNQEIMCVDVYPWPSDAVLGKYSKTIRSTDSKSLTMSSPRHLLPKQLTSTVEMDICPWDFPERFSCQWESEKLLKTDVEKPRDDVKKTTSMPYPLTKQLKGTAETCPWDYPESPSIEKEVYVSESEEASLNPKQKGTVLTSQVSSTKKTDSSSQGAEGNERSEGFAIRREADTLDLQKESVHAKICLWENVTVESEQPVKLSKNQTSLHVNVDPLHTVEPEKQIQKNKNASTDICPWETEQPPKLAQGQNYLQTCICPWELEVSGKSKKQASVSAHVSPWETDSEPPLNTKDSIAEKRDDDTSAHTAQGAKAIRPLTRCDALCPWEMKGGSQASITELDNSNIFTWEEPIAEEESDAEIAAEAIIFPDL